MDSLIAWLSGRKSLATIIASAYFAGVVFLHKEVSRIFDWLSETLSFRVYDSMMVAVSSAVAFSIGAYLVRSVLQQSAGRGARLVALFGTVLLMVVAHLLLIVFAVEDIHFFQYAVLVIPVFALTLRYGETVLWVTLLGSFDEMYQYFFLYRDNNSVYLDFNDIILNLIGAGIGVAIIFALSHRHPEDRHGVRRPIVSTAALAVSLILLSGCVGLAVSDSVKFYPDDAVGGGAIILSRKQIEPAFWTEPRVGKKFHIMSPAEGLATAVILTGLYLMMDRYADKARNS